MKHGLSSNFNKLCNALAKLEEEGISFEIDGKYVQVYFVITYIHGDNLGLNSMLGYKRNFRCDGCCRICIATFEEIQSFFKENKRLLRMECLNSKIGIEQHCPFENIPSFYVVDNISVDVFHEFNEGILHTEISFSLTYFINQNFIDLTILNHKKKGFSILYSK